MNTRKAVGSKWILVGRGGGGAGNSRNLGGLKPKGVLYRENYWGGAQAPQPPASGGLDTHALYSGLSQANQSNCKGIRLYVSVFALHRVLSKNPRALTVSHIKSLTQMTLF